MNKNYLLILALFVATLSFGQNTGDIIITEIMQNPLNPISDDDAEWFEIYNTTGTDIDINGWTIRDNGSNLDTIDNSLIVPTGGYIVLGVNQDMALNGGVTIDYQYNSTIRLANGSDALILQTPDETVIDSVIWDNGDTFPDPDGSSMSLDPASFNSLDNNDGANWCEAITALGDTQFGTPGADNPVCGTPCTLSLGATTVTCDAVTEEVDTYTVTVAFSNGGTETFSITVNNGMVGGDDPSMMASGTITISSITEGTNLTLNVDSGESGTCHLASNVTSPVCDSFVPTCVTEGGLIFTEIMQNPAAPVSDDMGEWFEIHNTTDNAIDLHGYDIIDDNHSLEEEGFNISATLMIPAGGYLLFANNGDFGTNGGITPDWVYNYPLPTLGNGSDGITIQCSGEIIDIVVWDGGDTFPDPSGKSMSLDPGSTNATDNDDGTNWCEGITLFGTDFGTPGMANDVCPPPCTLELGATTATCDAETNETDTYTATLAFSGAGTQTFTITVNEGTVGGDDPTMMASGTITITGITEETNLDIDVSNESCNLSASINSPICDPFVPVCAAAGDLIFTEIMQNPAAPVSDDMGEWFEIYNTTDATINLRVYDIVDDNHTLAEEGFTISEDLMIEAGGFLVFATNGDFATNGGITPDWVYNYPLPTLGNGSDGITIQCDENIIDQVIWDGGDTFPDPSGKSMSLDPNSFNSLDNDDGANWCEATTQFGTDFGTPGAANDICAEPCPFDLGSISTACDATTEGVDTYTAMIDFSGGGSQAYTITIDSGTRSGDDPSAVESGTIIVSGIAEGTDLTINITGGTCNISRTITSAVCVPAICSTPGSVVITEIMQNPDAVSDSAGEWFEVFNFTNTDINLQGWSIMDDNMAGEGFTVATSLVLPAGGYLLFANNGDAATNGGLTPNYVYDSSLTLGNGTDGLQIQCSGALIDIVIWDGGTTFPNPTGVSMELDINHLNAAENNFGMFWGLASTPYGDGDMGTPGAMNTFTTSIREIAIEGLNVFPNPTANGNINITTTSTARKEVAVYNMLGVKILSTAFEGRSTEIQLGDISAGVYFLRINEGKRTAALNVVVR